MKNINNRRRTLTEGTDPAFARKERYVVEAAADFSRDYAR